MSDYDIEIHRKLKDDKKGNIKTEIWAKIKDSCTGTTVNKLIWWEDDNGIYHDATPELEPDFAAYQSDKHKY